MTTSEKGHNSAAVPNYSKVFDITSDFEAVQICFNRVANLCQVYHEMLENDLSTEENPDPYVVAAYWKRRALYFSQFEAIEILFQNALKEMTETVQKSYAYCWELKEQGGKHNGR